jgi:diacylglycerol kinase (ATP)
MKFLKNRIKSFGNAFRGMRFFLQEEVHGRIHLLAIFVTTLAGFYFKISSIEWCLILICFSLVMVTEILNSAIERTIDRHSTEHHPLAGKAKDMAAAAVLFASFIAITVAFLIFFPKK